MVHTHRISVKKSRFKLRCPHQTIGHHSRPKLLNSKQVPYLLQGDLLRMRKSLVGIAAAIMLSTLAIVPAFGIPATPTTTYHFIIGTAQVGGVELDVAGTEFWVYQAIWVGSEVYNHMLLCHASTGASVSQHGFLTIHGSCAGGSLEGARVWGGGMVTRPVVVTLAFQGPPRTSITLILSPVPAEFFLPSPCPCPLCCAI